MNIETIQTGITNGFTASHEAISNAVIWLGHKIQFLSKTYLVPVLEKLGTVAANAYKALQTVVKSGPLVPFTIASALFLAGIAAFKIADHKAYEDEMLAKAAWKALGIATFTLATAATSVGIASIVLA